MTEAGTQLGAIVDFNPDKDIDENTGAGSITIKAEVSDKVKWYCGEVPGIQNAELELGDPRSSPGPTKGPREV